MTTLSNNTISTSFAKIITFENGRQCVLYFDHLESEPTVRMIMNSYGMNSSTKLNLDGQGSREDKTKTLQALLQVFDEAKASEMMKALDQTIEKKLLPEFFPGTSQNYDMFAKFLDQDESKILIIKDFNGDKTSNHKNYLVREISSNTAKEHVFKTKESRDEAFTNWETQVFGTTPKKIKP